MGHLSVDADYRRLIPAIITEHSARADFRGRTRVQQTGRTGWYFRVLREGTAGRDQRGG